MNVLIVDPSVVPDVAYQQAIVQQLAGDDNVAVRLATGVLQATWQTRQFNPDVIVFDRIDDCEQIRKLVALLHGIHPGVAIFYLDDAGRIAGENPCPAAGLSIVPTWLRDLAAGWVGARSTTLPALAQCVAT